MSEKFYGKENTTSYKQSIEGNIQRKFANKIESKIIKKYSRKM